MDTVTTLDKGHGRRERRTLKATTALNEYLDWPGVAQVGQVESDVVKDGKTTHETRYFITSVSRAVADAGQLLKWTRGHWSIENRSHYVRDVTMGEDSSRVRKRSGPQVMAAFRNATIGLLRTMGVTNIAEALRRNASQVGQLFARLGIFKLRLALPGGWLGPRTPSLREGPGSASVPSGSPDPVAGTGARRRGPAGHGSNPACFR